MTETLDLVLKGKWYDMIESGEKKEEYRAKTPYWVKRLLGCERGEYCHHKCCGQCSRFKPKPYTRVCFHRGYTSKRVMCFELKEIWDGFGEVQWGAPADEHVFILALGERLL